MWPLEWWDWDIKVRGTQCCVTEQGKVVDDTESFRMVGNGAWLNQKWMEGLVFGQR